jgi:hypothetical protein
MNTRDSGGSVGCVIQSSEISERRPIVVDKDEEIDRKNIRNNRHHRQSTGQSGLAEKQ